MPLVVFFCVKFGFRKSCKCKRNDKYEVWVGFNGFYNSRSDFMVFHGSRLVLHGWRLVFHGSRSVFMVPGRFSWFFMVPGWFFMFSFLHFIDYLQSWPLSLLFFFCIFSHTVLFFVFFYIFTFFCFCPPSCSFLSFNFVFIFSYNPSWFLFQCFNPSVVQSTFSFK